MVSRKRVVFLVSSLILLVLIEEGLNILQKGRPHRYLRYEMTGAIKYEGRTLFLNPNDPHITRIMLERGHWEPTETALFMSTIKTGDTVIDVGANIGHFTILGSILAGSSGRVIAFEPDPESYSFLLKNIDANGIENVTPRQKALSNESGTIKLFLSKTNRGDHRIYQTGERDSVDVEATTLDEYLRHDGSVVDFIKIDTQGAELVILKGMQETLMRNRDVKLIVEFWPHGLAGLNSDAAELLRILESLRFELYDIREDFGIAVKTNPNMLLSTYTIPNEEFTNLYCRRPEMGSTEPVLDLRIAVQKLLESF